jgi:hypothetical protein
MTEADLFTLFHAAVVGSAIGLVVLLALFVLGMKG